jgi:hypothetical protein
MSKKINQICSNHPSKKKNIFLKKREKIKKFSCCMIWNLPEKLQVEFGMMEQNSILLEFQHCKWKLVILFTQK